MFYLLFIFNFICHTKITKNIGKEEKKKWLVDLTDAIGAYERLAGEKSKMERFMNCFHIYSII